MPSANPPDGPPEAVFAALDSVVWGIQEETWHSLANTNKSRLLGFGTPNAHFVK
jgi:hypothetical protein